LGGIGWKTLKSLGVWRTFFELPKAEVRIKRMKVHKGFFDQIFLSLPYHSNVIKQFALLKKSIVTYNDNNPLARGKNTTMACVKF